MRPADVRDVSVRLAAAGVAHAVTGGWGVDALVGEQTREHGNLDVAVADADGARRVLAGNADAGRIVCLGEDPSARPEGEVLDGWLHGVVPCLAPHVQRAFHTGLRRRPQDVHDLSIVVRAEHQRGIDARGFIVREGDPTRVQRALQPLVDDLVAFVGRSFGERLHSIYLYGSLPRGAARTAPPGGPRAAASDVDAQVALRDEVTPADRELAAAVAATLDELHESVRGFGILVDSVASLTDPAKLHDEGFHVSVLCTPVWGDDLAARIPPLRPGRALARGIQGNAPASLTRLRTALAESDAGEAAALCRSAGRRLARLGFATVMPRWGGWTSDPAVMAEVFLRLQPGRAEEMADAVALGWGGRTDPVLATTLCAGFGDWLTGQLG